MSTNNSNTLGLAMLGGGLAAASALAWRSTSLRAPQSGTSELLEWVHPVPSVDDRIAVVSNPFRAQASNDGKATQHLGVDLMYRRREPRDLIAVLPPGTPGGTPLFFMPENIPVLAAAVGLVSFADATPVGNTVIVRHPNGWATYYTHLSTLAVGKGSAVAAGQTIGTIGASPKDARHLRHLHLELWQNATRSGAIDPAPYLAAWSRIRIDGAAAFRASEIHASQRNGTMSSYRTVGKRGEPYPTWVRQLRGESGVYVIREIDGPIVYVGSSVGKLYATLTRHFQAWRRYKGFWRGQFAEGADPGLTYTRSAVEVAIKKTTPDDAHEEELRTIRRLQPRDNQLGQPELEDAPF